MYDPLLLPVSGQSSQLELKKPSIDSSCENCPDTGRSKGSYIIFYQGEPIDHGTHVPVPVAQ